MLRNTKTRIISSIIVILVVLAGAAIIGLIRYPCGMHYQCTTTAYGIKLTYPYGWHVKQSRLTPPNENKISFGVISPDKNTTVGIVPQYTVSAQNTVPGEQSYYMPIATHTVANFPNAVDVQFIGKIVIQGYPTSYAPIESLMLRTQYQQLGLAINSYSLLSENQQEFLFGSYGPNNTPIILIGIGQKEFSTESAAKAWFTQPYAQKAHAILLSAKLAH